jgi:fimbrial chaperone protein
MFGARNSVCAFLLFAFAVFQAWSFTLEPMTAQLDPSGEKSIATFRVDNDGPAKIAIRFRVLSRDVSVDGAETNAPVDALFAVYPARVLVEPGRFATVKIQWRGSSSLEREQCFRFVAEQVPVDADQGTATGLRILFRYVASVYVSESSFAPSLSVLAEASTDKSGKPGVTVEISNRGTRHVVAKDLTVDLAFDGGSSCRFGAAELGALGNFNYLPGCAVRVFVPVAKKLPDGPCAGSLRYESEE